MASIDYNSNEAPDTLRLNIENISKELNDLIVTGEQEFRMSQQFSLTAVSATAHSVMSTPALPYNYQVPMYKANTFNDQQQIYATNTMPGLKHNLNYYMNLQQNLHLASVNNMLQNVAVTQAIYTTNSRHSTLGSTQNLYSSCASPTYEFYYLRSNGESDTKASTSSGSNGVYRKNPRISHKHFHQKPRNSCGEKEQIKVDLSKIDLTHNSKENSTVQYLFELLRDLHRAVAETPPSHDSISDSQYEDTFTSNDIKLSTMPSTLNIQNQIKQGCRQLTIFICEMQRLLATNKIFEPKMHAECEYYLNSLHQSLTQLEDYKRIEMEHKRGQFLREEVRVHAERLVLLLEYINRQIREVHIRIMAFNWFVGVKYRGDVQIAAMQSTRDIGNKEILKKSKIGVINEILQMCNIPKINTTLNTNSITTTTTNINTQQIATITKPDIDHKSPTKLIYNEDDNVLNVKPLLNKNNIFIAYKPEQTRRATAATLVNTTNSHTRHPVFYIG